MNQPVAINKLSAQLGLSSRILRHWESEGLLTSTRDQESGWRVYDQEAIFCIKITAILRKLEIPLRDIKEILDTKSYSIAEQVIRKQILLLDRNSSELTVRRNMLKNLLNSMLCADTRLAGNSLTELCCFFQNLFQNDQNKKVEDIMSMNSEGPNGRLRFITLPPMRVVYNTAIGVSPEDEAMLPVIEWLESFNLMGTAKLYGGNVKPFPSKSSPQYGYGMCASIPEDAKIPEHLKEMRLPGGLYAMMPSSEDIFGSWQLLMKNLSQNKEYTSDRSRLCLEEHIRNDNSEGQGGQYILNLLEPVKKK